MTKELTREVSGFYLSSPCKVWWIAESVLNMSRSRADGTMSSWLLYFRNFTNFHTILFGRHYGRNAQARPPSCPIFLPMLFNFLLTRQNSRLKCLENQSVSSKSSALLYFFLKWLKSKIFQATNKNQAACALRLRYIVDSFSIWRWKRQNSAYFDWTFSKS